MYGQGRPFAYQANQVSTVNKNKLVVMLYDGAIRFCTEARDRSVRGDIAGRGLYVSKTQKIVAELMNSLNHDKGGEVAKSLHSLYMEATRLLTNANLKGRREDFESVIQMMTEVRDSWNEVINGGAPAAAAASPAMAAAPSAPPPGTARFAYRA
ncbi:MAG: flagellar export chaperone FliS [Nitrospinae bacterium]|nr:flagellar export chaperone FliS [Nitrospinota bacterium]